MKFFDKKYLPLVLLVALFACKQDPKSDKNTAGSQTNPQLARLNELIAQTPNNDTLYFQRADWYYSNEAYDEALTDLNHALRLDSLQPAYYHLLADVLIDYARPNDSKRAIDVLKLAAERFPNRIPTLLKLSEFQLIVRQHEDALGTLNKILLRDPQNAEAYFMTSRVAIDMGDTLRAVTALQKSVQLDAENTDAWMFLGRIFSSKNNPRAVQCFDNAVRVDTNNFEALEFKGAYYKRRGQYEKAMEVYRDIIVRNPDYSNAYFDTGMIYLEQDSVQKAQANFNLAIKTDPLFVKAFYYRGISYEMEGKPDLALADYKQAYKMRPSFQEAKDAMERLSR